MTEVLVDPGTLRSQVQSKYREVALHPDAQFHFHTGRPLATRLGYPDPVVARLPEAVVESFARGGHPVALRPRTPGAQGVDLGCGAGFDTQIAADQGGPTGRVVGVDMTPEMLAKARRGVAELGLDHVEVRGGIAERLPVDDGWADVAISNGVINLCADKAAVFTEIRRVLRPGGVLQFADIATGNPVPVEAMRDIDLWTG